MKISIILPAFNEEKLVERSLQSIRCAATAFSRLGWEHEIIVCDNNSTDRTAELARKQSARVVFEPVNQISRARNAGAAAATGEWFLFVDADSFPSVAGAAADARASRRRRRPWYRCRVSAAARRLHWINLLDGRMD